MRLKQLKKSKKFNIGGVVGKLILRQMRFNYVRKIICNINGVEVVKIFKTYFKGIGIILKINGKIDF